jgi:hypothetical protein
MKATIEIPDDLYRRVKAKSAIEGQPVRQVVMHLFQGWLGQTDELPADKPVLVQSRPAPAWFGAARKYAHRVKRHDLNSVRRSIAQGRALAPRRPPAEGPGQ